MCVCLCVCNDVHVTQVVYTTHIYNVVFTQCVTGVDV